ncbi:MAG: alpha-D-ribose 1-methylphosphonate 5-triphosphate diphosphatase [Pseudomonadota bacterium]
MAQPITLVGGTVVTPDGTLERADVPMAGGVFMDKVKDAQAIDCRGHYVLPGIVDVHGDAFELELHPRPGVDIAFPIAIGSIDKQLVSNGITTAFHGLTVSWEPGARSLGAARRFMGDLAAARPRLMADHRVQLRWEVFAHETLADIARWLRETPTPAIAFNDHTTDTLDLMAAGRTDKLDPWARRAGVDLDTYLALASTVAQSAAAVPAKVAEVARLGRAHSAVMLSHDERTRADRSANRALGMRVCEFPLAPEVAADARANGEPVVMGGPNVIRGASHKGLMSAEEAIGEGLCTVLASDYYYPSLLHAAERLVARGVTSLAAAWSLISQNPADAMGLADRGAIAPGRQADAVVVDASGPWRIVHTITRGIITRFGA